MKAVSVENLTHAFRVGDNAELPVLKDISFEAEEGEFLSIIGPSGCGKSTILNIIAGLIKPTNGTVRIFGQKVNGPLRGVVGYVFQDPLLLSWRTVYQNVALGLELLDYNRKDHGTIVSKMIKLVNLEGFEHLYPFELSGGMKQRVSLARALAPDPKVLLMDEPFGALDEQTRTNLGLELLKIRNLTGKTIIFVTHSLLEASMLSDKIVVLSKNPAMIKDLIQVDLPQHMREPESPEVQYIRRRLWNSLMSK